MAETYRLQVAGLTRELQIFPINDKVSIAALIMLGDVELTIACATALLERVPEFDVMLTAEAKSIPLVYEMSRQSGKPYITARKGIKLYMEEPVGVEVKTITTENKQMLYLGKSDMQAMQGKRVLLVDDVVSTGGAIQALGQLAGKTTGTVVGRAAVLAEGDAAQRKDLIFLAPLPLITDMP